MNDTNQSLEQSLELLNEALSDLAEAKQQTVVSFSKFVNFHAKKGENNYGKGISWTGQGHTRQFVFSRNDSLWSSENIDLEKTKSYKIGGEDILSQTELKESVTKSHLKELGRLKGLIVDGSVSINQHIYYDNRTKKLGIGTENSRYLFGLAEKNQEIGIGFDSDRAKIGTVTAASFDLISGNINRISIEKEGNIFLGDKKQSPISVSIHGKLSIGVLNPDSNVDLHVNGSVRLHNRLFTQSDAPPSSGSYQLGDIVWNQSPTIGGAIGWVCIKSGSPGLWAKFGNVSHLG